MSPTVLLGSDVCSSEWSAWTLLTKTCSFHDAFSRSALPGLGARRPAPECCVLMLTAIAIPLQTHCFPEDRVQLASL